VLTPFGEVVAEKAVSCLVKPEIGDRVLISLDQTGNSFILSVLQRPKHKNPKVDLVFHGDVRLHVKKGGLSLASDDKVSIASQEELAFVSKGVSVHANEGKVKIERLSYIGRILHSQVKRIKVIANTVENTFRRLTQGLENAFRFIREYEEIQSGSTRYLVEDTLTMHSKNAVHMAQEIVTINGEQVHLG